MLAILNASLIDICIYMCIFIFIYSLLI